MTPFLVSRSPGHLPHISPLPPLTPDPGIEALIAQANIYFYSVDYRTGRFRHVSSGIVRLLGYDTRSWQFAGPKKAFQHIHPDDQDSVRRICTEIRDELTRHPIPERSLLTFAFTCRVQHALGHYLHLNHQLSFPRLDGVGNPLTDFAVVSDISALQAPHSCMLLVRRTHQGKLETLRTQVFNSSNGVNFSGREMEVLELVARGCSSQEIGERLFISYNTVCTHRKNLMKKAGVNCTVDLLRFARGIGVVQ